MSATNEQYGLAKQTAVTERFAKAIEHLGNSSLDIRLGGIYLLERLSVDSPQDRSAIFDVLSAFVRTHAPNGPACGQGSDAKPDIDIQSVVTVISRRSSGGPERIDLSNSCLANGALDGVNLRGAVLRGANLGRAQLWKSDLSHADLSYATLQDATLAEADLTGAKFMRANMFSASLRGARLTDAAVLNADLRNATLEESTLDRASFSFSDARGAVFGLPTGTTSYHRTNTKDWPEGRWTAPDTAFRGAHLGTVQFDDDTLWPSGFVPQAKPREVLRFDMPVPPK